MTPRQLQIVRRVHHAIAWHGQRELVRLEVGDVQVVLNTMWVAVKRADIAEARLPERTVEKAESRLDELLGTLTAARAQVNGQAGERRQPQAPPRQLELAGVPARRPVELPPQRES